ncbi:hypothetical protein ACA910_015867 [Epithemia clementina (nom. ined.)]
MTREREQLQAALSGVNEIERRSSRESQRYNISLISEDRETDHPHQDLDQAEERLFNKAKASLEALWKKHQDQREEQESEARESSKIVFHQIQELLRKMVQEKLTQARNTAEHDLRNSEATAKRNTSTGHAIASVSVGPMSEISRTSTYSLEDLWRENESLRARNTMLEARLDEMKKTVQLNQSKAMEYSKSMFGI